MVGPSIARPGLRISIVVAIALALALSAVASGAEPSGKCKEVRVAQAKSILGQRVYLQQGGDFDGQRSICTISIGTTAEAIVIEKQSAKRFRSTIGYFRARAAIGRVKDMVAIRLGDEGYKLRFAGDGTANVLVFRVGSRMFTLSAEPRPSVTAAKRLALGKAVATTARSR